MRYGVECLQRKLEIENKINNILKVGINEVVVTLYEGHYHYGVAALLNSLDESKFDGLFYVGYRGGLPPWVSQLVTTENGYATETGLRIHFEDLHKVEMHLGYHKPHIAKHIFLNHPEVEKVFYFDPDIVVNAVWSFFSSWADRGVTLCVDAVFDFLHHTHPWRFEWRLLGKDISQEYNKVDFFANAGFFGVSRQNILFLDHWIAITETYERSGRSIKKYEQHLASNAIKSDQDLLNAVITISPSIEYSIIGKEGMAFQQPAYLMSHAIGDGIKPWKRNFIKNIVVRGGKPSTAEVDYFKYTVFPIKIFSSYDLKIKKINIKISKLISRFWKI